MRAQWNLVLAGVLCLAAPHSVGAQQADTCVLFFSPEKLQQLVSETPRIDQVVDQCVRDAESSTDSPVALLVSQHIASMASRIKREDGGGARTSILWPELASAQVLAQLNRPWPFDKRVAGAVYAGIQLMNERLDSEAEANLAIPDATQAVQLDQKAAQADIPPSELLRYLELALANGEGLFNTAAAVPFDSDVHMGERIELFSAMEKYPATSFSLRAILLRAEARVLSITAGFSKDAEVLYRALEDYDTVLCSYPDHEQATAAFPFCRNRAESSPNYLWESEHGWRWLNDVLYDRTVLLTLLGQFADARASMKTLADWQPVLRQPQKNGRPIGSTPYYSALRIGPAARVAQHDRAYVDQINVYQTVPGLKVPLKKFYATRDLAGQALKVIDQAEARFEKEGLRPLARSSVVGKEYLDFIDFVAGQLHSIERRDNVVVFGSFRERHRAEALKERLVQTIARDELDAAGCTHCVLGVRELPTSGHFQVRVEPDLSETEVASVLQVARNAGVTDLFISRPRVP